MVIAKMSVQLATPNEEGKKLDFTSPLIVKEIKNYTEKFNAEQPHKELKICSISPNQILFYIKSDIVLNGNGHDIKALSNIFRDGGWYKYSTSEKLLTVGSYNLLEDFKESYENVGILPVEYNYAWTEDLSKVLSDEDAVELLKSLIILKKNAYMGSQKKYQNSLYKIKEELFSVFF